MYGNEAMDTVYFKGESCVFHVPVEDEDTLNRWRAGQSIPLPEVVGISEILKTDNGTQGIKDTASKSDLSNQFGHISKDDMIRNILTYGVFQHGTAPGKGGRKDAH